MQIFLSQPKSAGLCNAPGPVYMCVSLWILEHGPWWFDSSDVLSWFPFPANCHKSQNDDELGRWHSKRRQPIYQIILYYCHLQFRPGVTSHPGQTSPAYIEREIRPILSLLLKIHLQSLIPGDKRPQLGLGNTFLLSLRNNVKATQKGLIKRLIASFFLFN